MLNLNKILITGRLTKDPELCFTNKIPVVSFTIAVQRKIKVENQTKFITDFFDVVAWRNTAEFICRYFNKGAAIYVCGSLQVQTWTEKEKFHKRFEIMADEVNFAEYKKESTETIEAEQKTESKPKDETIGKNLEFEELTGEDSELPFN